MDIQLIKELKPIRKILIVYTFTFGLYARLIKETLHHSKKLHFKLLLKKYLNDCSEN